MSIQTELELAMTKMIEEIDGFVYKKKKVKLAKLTEDNVAIVEAMIRNDSAYIKSSDVNASPRGKYGGSTAYWMAQLKNYLFTNKQNEDTYKIIIENAVNAVDRENSTHITNSVVCHHRSFLGCCKGNHSLRNWQVICDFFHHAAILAYFYLL